MTPPPILCPWCKAVLLVVESPHDIVGTVRRIAHPRPWCAALEREGQDALLARIATMDIGDIDDEIELLDEG